MSAISLLHRQVHNDQNSLANRLQSIHSDSEYVGWLRSSVYPGVPFFANLRQGPWYMPFTDSDHKVRERVCEKCTHIYIYRVPLYP
jgi:hypothetical protein